MSDWSPTYKAVCDICGETQEVSNYGDWACRKCGQGYTYDECHQIRLTDSQWALLRNPPRWIPVEERLPDRYIRVLAFVKCEPHEHPHAIGFVGSLGLWSLDELHEPSAVVTHWMPLPEPPEVK